MILEFNFSNGKVDIFFRILEFRHIFDFSFLGMFYRKVINFSFRGWGQTRKVKKI